MLEVGSSNASGREWGGCCGGVWGWMLGSWELKGGLRSEEMEERSLRECPWGREEEGA
jgi:hypothetical protein